MKEIIRKITTAIGVGMFIIGVCSADSESLIVPLVLTFGGLAILYPNYKYYEENEDEAE